MIGCCIIPRGKSALTKASKRARHVRRTTDARGYRIGMKMKWITIPLLLVLSCSYCFAQESLEEIQGGLLRSNFAQTPYTAWVKITDVKEKGNELLYPTYLIICDVLETFKGKRLKRIEYLRGVEDGYKELPIGKSYIVSLFINKENGLYYLSDNGYELPASKHLLTVARQLTKKIK
jgi:hypothetical protein